MAVSTYSIGDLSGKDKQKEGDTNTYIMNNHHAQPVNTLSSAWNALETIPAEHMKERTEPKQADVHILKMR